MSAHRVWVFSAKAAWCRACTCMHTSVTCCNCTPLHQVSYVVTKLPAGSMQVLSSAGTWQPVALGPNQVAVFAGETLKHATAGAVHAALHRVSQREVRRSPSFCSASTHTACCASSVRLFRARASCEQATIACCRLAMSHGFRWPTNSAPRHTQSLTCAMCQTLCRTIGKVLVDLRQRSARSC